MMRDLIRRILREQMEDKKPRKSFNSTDEFVDNAKQAHGDKYNYDKTKYALMRDKVIITCPIHGDFMQAPTDHIKGVGCPKCGHERRRQSRRKTNDYFISKAKEVHGDKYNYDKTNYEYSNQKVIITCPIHGDFPQIANDHLSGKGCSKCRESKGEKYVDKLLTNNNIKFTREYTFNDCSSISEKGFCTPLPFDFYLPEYNACIEYDGKQHFEPVWGHENFESTKRTDELKTDYCQKNGIKLIRIPYTMNLKNVEDYIKSELGI